LFKNYLKITLRNITKGKFYSLINITGLVTGLTAFILIALYVQNQYSYDSFNKKADRIYRVNKINTPSLGTEERHAISSGMMGPAMVKDYPEVEQSIRVLPWFSDLLFKRDNKEFKISDVVFADSNFFNVFDYKLLEGDSRNALVNPMSVILSKKVAKLFFGKDDPVGKIIYDSDKVPFKVTGVIENTPDNSHLRYNILISWSTTVRGDEGWRMLWANNWITQVDYTYLLLKPNANYKELEKKFSSLIKQHLPTKADQYKLYLQPLDDIYLGSSALLFTRGTRQGNGSYVKILLFAAILILLIASFNFMNLTSARALKKAKEVGVRKTFGAQKLQIIKQFLFESLLITTLATLLSVLFVEVLLPVFNNLAGIKLSINYQQLFLFIILLTLVVGIFSGIYPAILLSRFNSIRVLKGVGIKGRNKNISRKIFVGVQFVISAFLITSTIIIFSQMNYVQNKNLGFNPDQVITLETGGTSFSNKLEAFKNELLKNQSIKSATVSNSVPGQNMMSYQILPEGKADNVEYISSTIRVADANFAKTYELELSSGRYFSDKFPTDKTNGIVINRTLADQLEWKNPVGKRLDIKGEVNSGKVIGVVKDFHMNSLHHKIGPIVFYFSPKARTTSIKVKSANISSTINYIKKTWAKFDPEYSFEYKFLDKSFEHLYQSDLKMMNILGIFSGFAIFVACLGLLGLIAYSSERRKKEIGIRKVLGANSRGIILLLSKEYLLIISISTLLSWPATYYLMNNWLKDFAYRIGLNAWMFLLAGIISLVIAFFTMLYQALKVTNSNPVEALRYE